MKKLTVLLLFWLASLGAAVAQPVTTTVPGTLLTYPFTATGKITTLTPTTGTAGFNLPQGTAPSSPTNGDMWMTSAGLFFRNAGVTAGPIGSSGLIINGTPVTGGAATNVLYTDGSKLQAYVAVPLSILGSTSAAPTIAGNTMLGNWANATGAIVAQSMPPCSGPNQALNYTGNVGIGCITVSGTGGVVQIQRTTGTGSPSGLITSTSFTSGTSPASVTITPHSSSNCIDVVYQGAFGLITSSTGVAYLELSNGGGHLSQIAVDSSFGAAKAEAVPTYWEYVDAPATTSPVTYTVLAKVDSGSNSTAINGGDAAAGWSMTATELTTCP